LDESDRPLKRVNMSAQLYKVLSSVAAVVACGYQSVATTNANEPMGHGLRPARFELNCPDAAGSVLSKETIEPPDADPSARGVEGAQFTIGATGCGELSTLLVICADRAEGCFFPDERIGGVSPKTDCVALARRQRDRHRLQCNECALH
jgi:hypothetical protein